MRAIDSKKGAGRLQEEDAHRRHHDHDVVEPGDDPGGDPNCTS